MAVGAGRTLAAVLMFALLAAGCAVAPWDAAAFDAPKRLLVALALGTALWIALWWVLAVLVWSELSQARAPRDAVSS